MDNTATSSCKCSTPDISAKRRLRHVAGLAIGSLWRSIAAGCEFDLMFLIWTRRQVTGVPVGGKVCWDIGSLQGHARRLGREHEEHVIYSGSFGWRTPGAHHHRPGDDQVDKKDQRLKTGDRNSPVHVDDIYEPLHIYCLLKM